MSFRIAPITEMLLLRFYHEPLACPELEAVLQFLESIVGSWEDHTRCFTRLSFFFLFVFFLCDFAIAVASWRVCLGTCAALLIVIDR